jgi:small subunit ribosomal protein S16
MVKIRLRRVGAKKKPTYRVVVADSRSPRDGRFIENIGHYDPRTDPPTVVIHEDRALYWLSVGAQPSDPVARFFDKLGLPAKLTDVHGGAKIEDVAAPRTVAPGARAKAPKARHVGPAAPEVVPVEVVVAAPAEVVAEAAVVETAETVAEVVADSAASVVEATVETVEDAAAPEVLAPEPVPSVAPVGGSLEDLGLSARVVKTLEGEGIASVADLVTRLAGGEDALREIPGIGPKAAEEIHARLAERGLATGN